MKYLAFLLTLFSLSAFAQDSTKVRLFVKGGEQYFVRINGELQEQTNILTVASGSHDIEIWSFKKRLFKDKLETGKLDSTNYFAELKLSSEYVGFLQETDQYKRKLFFAKTAPFLITGVSLIALPFTLSGRINKHEELVQNTFLNNRNQVPDKTLENTQLQYNTVNTLFFVCAAGAILGGASFFLLKPYAHKLTPPAFKQQNPFTFEYLKLTYNRTIQSPEFGLTFNF